MVTALSFGRNEELWFSAAVASRTHAKPHDGGLELGRHGGSGPRRRRRLGAVVAGVPSMGHRKQAKVTWMRASGEGGQELGVIPSAAEKEKGRRKQCESSACTEAGT